LKEASKRNRNTL
jgi:hypothetical protein